MPPEISEFSYGFALTNEIVKRFAGLTVAPIFPSLYQEGQTGGGFDVKLGDPSFPIYLQFKLSEKMVGESAREFKLQLEQPNLEISLPYFRFSIMDSRHSKQHEMLLSLDQAGGEVFYAAPRFRTPEELDAAFTSQTVAEQSSFVRPRTIGALSPGKHTCVLSPPNVIVCSEPFRIQHIGVGELQNIVRSTITNNSTAFGADLAELIFSQFSRVSGGLSDLDKAVLRSEDDLIEGTPDAPVGSSAESQRPIRLRYDSLLESLNSRMEMSKDPLYRISKLSEFSMSVFGLQLFVVQKKPKPTFEIVIDEGQSKPD